MLLLLACLHVTAAVIGSAAGALVAWWLTPNARALLLAVALLAGGAAALLPQGRATLPRRPVAAIAVLVGLALTDRAAFLTFALAAGSASPWLTAAGTAAGSIAATALALSDPVVARWMPSVGRIAGAVLLLAGLVVGLGALRLI